MATDTVPDTWGTPGITSIRDQNSPSFLGFPSFTQLPGPHYALLAGNSCHFLVFGENPFWSLSMGPI